MLLLVKGQVKLLDVHEKGKNGSSIKINLR